MWCWYRSGIFFIFFLFRFFVGFFFFILFYSVVCAYSECVVEFENQLKNFLSIPRLRCVVAVADANELFAVKLLLGWQQQQNCVYSRCLFKAHRRRWEILLLLLLFVAVVASHKIQFHLFLGSIHLCFNKILVSKKRKRRRSINFDTMLCTRQKCYVVVGCCYYCMCAS